MLGELIHAAPSDLLAETKSNVPNRLAFRVAALEFLIQPALQMRDLSLEAVHPDGIVDLDNQSSLIESYCGCVRGVS